MSDLVRSHIVIRRAEGAIFALIANIAGYHQWLPGSTMSVLGTDYSALGTDVGPGTFYTDRFQGDLMRGEVVEWQPPTQIRLRQSARVRRWGLAGRITMDIHYALKQDGLQTDVLRDVTLHTSGIAFLLKLTFMYKIDTENKRILHMMKMYLEAIA